MPVQNLLHGAQANTAAAQRSVSRRDHNSQQQNTFEYLDTTRFCELYQRWRRKLDIVLRQQHRAGEKLFVDYAGATVPVENPRTTTRLDPRYELLPGQVVIQGPAKYGLQRSSPSCL